MALGFLYFGFFVFCGVFLRGEEMLMGSVVLLVGRLVATIFLSLSLLIFTSKHKCKFILLLVFLLFFYKMYYSFIVVSSFSFYLFNPLNLLIFMVSFRLLFYDLKLGLLTLLLIVATKPFSWRIFPLGVLQFFTESSSSAELDF